MNGDTKTIDEQLKQLLAGYQRHVATASRTWTTLAILSIYAIAAALLPSSADSSGAASGPIELPLVEHVSLDRHWFILITTGLLAVLITRWVEALSRAVHTRRQLVEPLLEGKDSCGVSRKDLWDAQVALGTSTVWSAPAAILRAKRRWIRKAALPYLMLLKLLAIVVHYGIPALTMCWLVAAFNSEPVTKGASSVVWLSVMYGLVGVGLLQLAFGVVAEVSYSKESVRHMAKLSQGGAQ